MKKYELSIVGRRIVTIPDDTNIADYVDAINDGNGSDVVEGGYDTFDELLEDMEYDSLDYREL